MSNQKRIKFIELAEKRVSRTIKNIRLIGNLSNKRNYKYTEDDVKSIYSSLISELRNMKSKFEMGGDSETPTFKLK